MNCSNRQRRHWGGFFLLAFFLGGGGLVFGQGTPPGPRPAVEAPEFSIPREEKEIPAWLARWELARVLTYARRYDEAVSEYEKLLKEKPALHEARIERARVLYWQGRGREALGELRKVPPELISGKTMVLMADLCRDEKRYDEALSLYRRFLEKEGDDLAVRLRLAEVLSWTKRYDESLAQYSLILKARPADIQLRRKYAFVLMWAGRHAEAIEELKRTLE